MSTSRWLYGLLLLALVAAAFEWAWLPYQDARERLEEDVARAETQFWWTQAQLAVLTSSATGAPRRATLAAVEGAMRRYDIRQQVERLEPRDETLRVVFENARFDRLVAWMTVLKRELRLNFESFDFTPGASEGVVSGAIVIAGIQP